MAHARAPQTPPANAQPDQKANQPTAPRPQKTCGKDGAAKCSGGDVPPSQRGKDKDILDTVEILD